MFDDVKKVLVTKEEIDAMVKGLADRISRDYEGKQLVLIGVMKGCLIFLADLLRNISIPVEFGTITASSYGSGTVSSGQIKIINDIDIGIEGKDVIIIEDLVDTGLTLNYLKDFLKLRKPKSVSICVAFDKPSRRKHPLDVTYKGMDIPDEFIVGYGLDFDEKYRNLPEICVLKEEIYSGSID
ncbi:MAG TPA: hypoxanthine phosphoribosyltransferase [Clostridia bacterium]|nr:hypoxanthine phosphoribosyltransferase [Clostridia bacterium]HPQ46596.1 hypoxanthine phosphoribosyltransferase [Clostridia bacterium]